MNKFVYFNRTATKFPFLFFVRLEYVGFTVTVYNNELSTPIVYDFVIHSIRRVYFADIDVLYNCAVFEVHEPTV